MKTFFDSLACRSGKFCAFCRAKTEQGASWRASTLLVYPELKENEFACPFGVAWDAGKQAPRQPDAKPPVTFKKVASFIEAMLLSPRVSKEVEAQRLAICATCDKRRVPKDGSPFCSMCSCKVSDEGWRLTNLAAYAENLPRWGCKHPRRGDTDPNGKQIGWPAAAATSAT